MVHAYNLASPDYRSMAGVYEKVVRLQWLQDQSHSRTFQGLGSCHLGLLDIFHFLDDDVYTRLPRFVDMVGSKMWRHILICLPNPETTLVSGPSSGLPLFRSHLRTLHFYPISFTLNSLFVRKNKIYVEVWGFLLRAVLGERIKLKRRKRAWRRMW